MPDHFYVYPEYLDKGRHRNEGRRIPAEAAPTAVTLEEIQGAATALGFKASTEADKHYPRHAHGFLGRVKVVKRPGVSKGRFLVDLAKEITRRRPATRKG